MIRAFMFAERGHGTALAVELRRVGVNLLGVCATKPPNIIRKARTALAKTIVRDGWPVADPFADYPEPTEIDLPFFDRADMAGVISFLRDQKPRVITACGFPTLIPNEALACANHALNVHPGLLPERPGGTPNRWAIYHGDKLTGVTVHRMTDKFDAGEIVYRKETELRGDWGEVERSLTPLILKAGIETIWRADAGVLSGWPNPVTKTQPSLRGKRARIDWNKDASEIVRLFRAMRPKTGGMTSLNGKPISLWDGYAVPKNNDKGEPGTIVSRDDDGPYIMTGGDVLKLTRLVVGSKVIEASDYHFRIGDRFT